MYRQESINPSLNELLANKEGFRQATGFLVDLELKINIAVVVTTIAGKEYKAEIVATKCFFREKVFNSLEGECVNAHDVDIPESSQMIVDVVRYWRAVLLSDLEEGSFVNHGASRFSDIVLSNIINASSNRKI